MSDNYGQEMSKAMEEQRELESDLHMWKAPAEAAQAKVRGLEADNASISDHADDVEKSNEAKHLISPALRAQGTDSDERERIRQAINVITQNGDTAIMTRDEATRMEIDCLRQQVKEQADQIVNLKRDNAVGVACEPWRNHDIEDAPDADSPLYWVWEAAVESTLEQAHAVLGGDFTYEGGDGGDEGPEAAVCESFRNMFVARGLMDRETHAVVTRADLARIQAEAAAKLADAVKDAADWKRQFEMFANAWSRELGMRRAKTHLIDELALGTRTLKAEAAAMREALRECTMTFGHSHWDSTGRSGAGCTACIAQRSASELARKATSGTAGRDLLERLEEAETALDAILAIAGTDGTSCQCQGENCDWCKVRRLCKSARKGGAK